MKTIIAGDETQTPCWLMNGALCWQGKFEFTLKVARCGRFRGFASLSFKVAHGREEFTSPPVMMTLTDTSIRRWIEILFDYGHPDPLAFLKESLSKKWHKTIRAVYAQYLLETMIGEHQ